MASAQAAQEDSARAFKWRGLAQAGLTIPLRLISFALMASGDGYDVFISYARSDGDAAAELNGWLGAQGVSTFFDRSALRPGLRWVPALEEAIGRSRAVAILVGTHGIGNTQQYERELALVRQTGDPAFPVIPVLMPGCDSRRPGFCSSSPGSTSARAKAFASRPTASQPSAPRSAARRLRPPPSGRRSAPTGASSRSAKRMRRSSAAATTRSASLSLA